MIEIKKEVRRGRGIGLYGEVTEESVMSYLDELTKATGELDLPYYSEKLLEIDGKRVDEIKNLIDNEIKLGLFYLRINEQKGNPDFDKWVFVNNKWIRDNGKVKIEISMDKGASTKITLRIENSSEHLSFAQNEDIRDKNLRNEESIKNCVEVFKIEGEQLLKKHQYPLYTDFEIKTLNKLLHITE